MKIVLTWFRKDKHPPSFQNEIANSDDLGATSVKSVKGQLAIFFPFQTPCQYVLNKSVQEISTISRQFQSGETVVDDVAPLFSLSRFTF